MAKNRKAPTLTVIRYYELDRQRCVRALLLLLEYRPRRQPEQQQPQEREVA